MHGIDLREIRAVLLIALIAIGIGWTLWLLMPSGQQVQFAQATVVSVGTGVQPSHSPKPVQAVITLRLDSGLTVTTKRSAKCMGSIRPGNRIRVRGDSTNAGAIIWRIDPVC